MDMHSITRHFGSQRAVAEKLGVTEAAVSAWKARGRIPLGRQYELQILTNGHLRAAPARQVSRRKARTRGA